MLTCIARLPRLAALIYRNVFIILIDADMDMLTR